MNFKKLAFAAALLRYGHGDRSHRRARRATRPVTATAPDSAAHASRPDARPARVEHGLTGAWHLVRDTVTDWSADKAPRLGAANVVSTTLFPADGAARAVTFGFRDRFGIEILERRFETCGRALADLEHVVELGALRLRGALRRDRFGRGLRLRFRCRGAAGRLEIQARERRLAEQHAEPALPQQVGVTGRQLGRFLPGEQRV